MKRETHFSQNYTCTIQYIQNTDQYGSESANGQDIKAQARQRNVSKFELLNGERGIQFFTFFS
jgi:hypothetical protein